MEGKRTGRLLAGCLLLALVSAAVAQEGGEERLWKETGETREGWLEPVRARPASAEEMGRVSPEDLDRIAELWARLEAKKSKAIPPLRYTVPVEATMAALALPPSTLGNDALAPDDFAVFKNTAPTDAVPSGFSSIVNEPSVVAVDESVFYTGNWYAADSSDGGDSFSFVNPFAGPFPAPDNGFCCDQVTGYSPRSGALFWVQQSFADTNNGTHRINVDQEADGAFDCFYDITPAIMGFGANTWPDFPDLALSDNFVYHSANVYSTTAGTFQGAFVARYPVDQMSACGSVPFKVYKDTGGFFSFKLTRGATTTMYFADHISNASMRIWRWPEAADAPTSFDRSVEAWNNATRVCPGPDGRDWCGRVDRRLAGAWVADGVVGFMWVPSQGSGFAFPYTRVARFSTFGLILVSEPVIWSSSFAWVYPSVAANRAGDLGGTIMAGGGASLYPSCVAWIADDANGDTIAPLENTVAYFGTSGPSSNVSGDYNSTHAYYPNDNLWAGACFGLDSTTSGHSRYVLFGREANASIFTDGFESGDVSSWSSANNAARLEVDSGSAFNGGSSLKTSVGPSCPPPDDLMLSGNVSGLFGACESVIASNAQVVAPGAEFQAPSVVLEPVFGVAPPTPFTATNVVGRSVYLTDLLPALSGSFGASFWLNLDDLALAAGDRIEHLRGLGNGLLPFRLSIVPAGPDNTLELKARLNGGGEVTSTPVVLPSGWFRLELRWRAGDPGLGNGELVAAVDGGSFDGLTGLGNSSLRVNRVLWGAVAGASDPATTGFLRMDLYGSWM